MIRAMVTGGVRFSLPLLEAAAAGPLDVVGVCTSSSPRGSDGLDLSPWARSADIPVLDAQDLNSAESVDWTSTRQPDLIICVGWSRLLKRQVLDIPRLGILGYHPAALPANRGRHPIIWTIALGLSTAGSTFFLMDERADTGPIVSQRSIAVAENETASSLYTRLNVGAVEQLQATAEEVVSRGTLRATPQDGSRATEWRKRDHDDGRIDWRMPSIGISRLVRALSDPYPGAHTVIGNREVRVTAVTVESAPSNLEPGRVLAVGSTWAVVKTGDGAVRVSTAEPLEGLIGSGDHL